jgi:hypothetical protein
MPRPCASRRRWSIRGAECQADVSHSHAARTFARVDGTSIRKAGNRGQPPFRSCVQGKGDCPQFHSLARCLSRPTPPQDCAAGAPAGRQGVCFGLSLLLLFCWLLRRNGLGKNM